MKVLKIATRGFREVTLQLHLADQFGCVAEQSDVLGRFSQGEGSARPAGQLLHDFLAVQRMGYCSEWGNTQIRIYDQEETRAIEIRGLRSRINRLIAAREGESYTVIDSLNHRVLEPMH